MFISAPLGFLGIEDVFEATSIEVQETIQWVGIFVRAVLVGAVWYVTRTGWSKLMHVLHGNTATPAKGSIEGAKIWRFLLTMNLPQISRSGFALVCEL